MDEGERQTREKQSSTAGEGVESQLGGFEVVAGKTSDSDPDVGEDDEDKREIEAVEEGGDVEGDPVLSRSSELKKVEEDSRRVSGEQHRVRLRNRSSKHEPRQGSNQPQVP